MFILNFNFFCFCCFFKYPKLKYEQFLWYNFNSLFLHHVVFTLLTPPPLQVEAPGWSSFFIFFSCFVFYYYKFSVSENTVLSFRSKGSMGFLLFFNLYYFFL